MPKLTDFYVTVIDFFGALLPGAVFMCLYGKHLADLAKVPALASPGATWPAFFVASYIVGQLVLGFGVHLNDLVLLLRPSKDEQQLYEATKKLMATQLAILDDRKHIFYRVHAFLRLQSAEATAEVDRQIAEYKLFRSLAVIFVIDLVASIFLGMPRIRIVLAAIAAALAVWRFAFLLQWTYRTAFEYFILVIPKGKDVQADAV